ncbi:MAG: DUF6304 family protein [Cytophagaceae bacterium]|nr:DUF6304 family protein [Cytophagaceae bacterium]MDW8455241.1 DUF6304 family protein [Cytophagaceae bacterium]
MNKTLKYNGTYTDNFGTTPIVVENNNQKLYTEIDGVKFSAYDFFEFVVDDKSNYTPQQLNRFTFSKTLIHRSNTVEERLSNCVFEIFVPQVIIDKTNVSEVYTELKIEYASGETRFKAADEMHDKKIKLSLKIEGHTFEGKSELFELALDQIRSQFDDKYHFKNCYGCMYGDYSVYGQNSFGTMLCFLSQKEKYESVTDKSEYTKLKFDEAVHVPETYCCENFKIRKSGSGYRG